jgi:hypothetical protein
VIQALTDQFLIERPTFDPATGKASFGYGLDGLHFTETLGLPAGADAAAAASPAFRKLLDLTAVVLGVSYFKLKAPFEIVAPNIALSEAERAFAIDVYENGLGEFYARNNLMRFGKLTLHAPHDIETSKPAPALPDRTLLPIGGGKDSLVSVDLLTHAGVEFTPFAVNPKGPILTSVDKIGTAPVYVTRTLDAEMIRLGKEPGYYNGHVPSTAALWLQPDRAQQRALRQRGQCHLRRARDQSPIFQVAGLRAADRLDPCRRHRWRAQVLLTIAPLFRGPHRLALHP